MANINKVNLGTASSPIYYDIESLHFIAGSLDTPAQWKQYIDDKIAQGLEIKVVSTLPTASAATVGKLYLVASSDPAKAGTYVEYITVNTGTESSPTYTWERIGTTEADLADYAKKTIAGKAGTYNSTGAGAATLTAEGYAATVDLSKVKYDKANAATGEAGAGSSATTGEAGGDTVSVTGASFSGTEATLTHTAHNHKVTAAGTISIGTGTANYTPAGSITGSQTIAAHSHTVNASTAAVSIDTTAASKKGVKVATTNAETGTVGISGGSITPAATVNVVTGVTAAGLSSATTESTGSIEYAEGISGSAPSLTGTKTFNTNAIKDITLSGSTTTTAGPEYVEKVTLPTMTAITFTQNELPSLTTKNYGFNTSVSNVMSAPTVSNGVLSWTTTNAGTQDALSAGSQASLTGGVFTAGSKTTKYMGHSTTTAGTGTVGISGGSYSATTKYLKATGGTASDTTPVVPSYTHTPATLTGTTTFAKSGLATASLTEDTSSTAPFQFNTDAIKAASSAQTFMTGVTLDSNGGATISGSNFGFSGTGVELKFTGSEVTSTNTTVGAHTYTPEGTVTGGSITIAAHSHSYTAPSAHTHSVSYTSTAVSGTATAAVASHTHTIGNHTHSVTISDCTV